MTAFQRIQNNLFVRLLAFACAFSVIFISCRPDLTSEIGSGLQPDNEFIGAHFNNTHESLRLTAYTIKDLPGMTSGRSFFALGSFKNAAFGTISVDLISQIDEMFRWDTVRGDFLGIDSVVMILVYAGVYPPQAEGAELDPFTISIGELAEPVLIDTLTLLRTYFSNDSRGQKNGGGTIVSNLEVRPNLRDSIPIFATVRNHDNTADSIIRNHDNTGDSILEMRHVATLRIPMYPNITGGIGGREFGERLLRTSADLVQTDSNTTASFVSKINGLYIQTHPEQVEGRGNIINFDFTGANIAPQIQVHYRRMTTVTDVVDGVSITRDTIVPRIKLYSFGFWSGMTYNYINIDRSTQSDDLANQINGTDTALGQNMVFLQSFFGSLARIEMPDIHRLLELELVFDTIFDGNAVSRIDTTRKRMVINQASLVLYPSANGRFTPTPSLNVGIFTDTIVKEPLTEIERLVWQQQSIRDHGVTIGGVHNTRGGRNEYRIILTRHIQNLLLDPDAANPPLTIFPANRLFLPDITSIYGPGLPVDDNRRMRLEIVYTLLSR
ncbi:MAG: DUF4270 domain-containing protein [Bacteroidales bacterium]|nr:DUF4270 domain-containing protein [Bacteroidales bacterium]